MSARVCPLCGKELDWVGDGPEWMNEYQWDAVKAGDYYIECENPNHRNGNCYFWERDGGLYRPEPKPSDAGHPVGANLHD